MVSALDFQAVQVENVTIAHATPISMVGLCMLAASEMGFDIKRNIS